MRVQTRDIQSTRNTTQRSGDGHTKHQIALNVDTGKLSGIAVKANGAHLIANFCAHKQPSDKNSCDYGDDNANVGVGSRNGISHYRNVFKRRKTVRA